VNWLNSEAFTLFDQHIKWSDMIGNVIGLLGLALGWRRSIWTWPVPFVSGLILFTAFATAHLSGSAGKQIVVMIVAAWGAVRLVPAIGRPQMLEVMAGAILVATALSGVLHRWIETPANRLGGRLAARIRARRAAVLTPA
jgi:hypothetical protein